MRQSIVEGCQLPTELIIISTQRANNDKVTRHVPSSLALCPQKRAHNYVSLLISEGNAPLIIFEHSNTSHLSSCLLNAQKQHFFSSSKQSWKAVLQEWILLVFVCDQSVLWFLHQLINSEGLIVRVLVRPGGSSYFVSSKLILGLLETV